MKQTDRGAHERAVMQLKLMEQQAPGCPKWIWIQEVRKKYIYEIVNLTKANGH